MRRRTVLPVAVLLAACSASPGAAPDDTVPPRPTVAASEATAPDPPSIPADTAPPAVTDALPTEPEPLPTQPTTTEPAPPETVSPSASAETVVVLYRIEVLTADAASADAADVIADVLTDPRGWSRAGFAFVRVEEAPYRIVVADGDEVDRLCAPYDTGGTYSCQNGPVVALNADRWREATPQWPADLDGYRTMLVNHEVGHLLHLHHPLPQCPGPGLPAPVMAQQSTSLGDCLPNPWPLQWEVDLAAARAEPLAPGAEHDPSDHRPSPPAVTD